MIKAEGLSGGYGDSRLIKNISLTVKKGEFLGILGPNGSGKTTLLHLLTGTLPAIEGSVCLAGKPLTEYKPKKLAQMMAVLPQKTEQAFSFTVKETVSFGRYPFQKGCSASRLKRMKPLFGMRWNKQGYSLSLRNRFVI